MIYISHRGNLTGPSPEFENQPGYIEQAIAQGFDVEVDLWVNESGPYLGHDGPKYSVPQEWLTDRTSQLWVHCKNALAINFCLRNNLHCFFHNTDAYTMTTRGFVWAYPGQQSTSLDCIKVLPEFSGQTGVALDAQYVGVCSDFIYDIKNPKSETPNASVIKPVDWQKHFVIGTPLVGWKCDSGEHMNWLEDRNAIMRKFPNAKFFAALELDERGLEPFADVINALREVNGDYWTYSINDMQPKVQSGNRWIRIETGRNLIREFAQRLRITAGHHWGEDCTVENIGVVNYEAILYVDSDISLNSRIIKKLLEVDRPLVGVNVPQYCLHGKQISKVPPIEEHWTTAGMLLVNAPAFYDLPWYHNSYLNLSDDPTFQSMAERLLRREGIHTLSETYGNTWVRKDIDAHHKGMLVAVEDRGIPDRKLNN